MFHLSFLKKLSPTHTHPLISICEISETLWVIISWVWVICKRLNVNWKTIHSIILCLTCHSLRYFPPLIHIPSYPFVKFLKPYELYFLEFESFISLNVNWKKIYSIILCITCHFLRNFPPFINIPSYPIMNFWNPMSYYFLGLSHL